MSRSTRIFKLIAAKRSGLVLCKDMLVVLPTDQIVRGFLLEATTERDMVYLWRVITPLYRPMTRVFLDYSNRIPNGEKIYINRKAYRESAEVIDSIIAAHIPALQKISQARDFLKHVGWKLGNDSINFRFDLALTYYRVGDVDQATRILQALGPEIDQMYEEYSAPMGQLIKKHSAPFDQWVKQAARQISSDPVGFGALLDEWEDRNVETLGLQASRPTSAAQSSLS